MSEGLRYSPNDQTQAVQEAQRTAQGAPEAAQNAEGLIYTVGPDSLVHFNRQSAIEDNRRYHEEQRTR